jgi:GH15 family glucan-1,4-alpha-glucosidase
LFLRLLDDAGGGYCALRFNSHVGTTRRYLPRTNILETCFQGRDGQLIVTDFMPIRRAPQLNDAGQDLLADHRIIRLLRCTEGEVELAVEVRPTFAFAQDQAKFAIEGGDVVVARGRDQGLHIQLQGQHLRPGANGTVAAHIRLRAGETAVLSLTVTGADGGFSPALPGSFEAALEETRRYWEQWSATCTYEGEYAELVLRSALALKLMTYEPTGAIVAAPTTSLPENIGGVRNWDYRFCWVRDATFTLISLMNLGYFGEARDFLHFLKRTVRDGERFQVLYRLDGSREAEERDFAHLPGYRNSRPVRAGNAAAHQQQLDIFGELVHCIYLYTAHPETRVSAAFFRAEFWPIVRAAADYVAARWREPDKGIWEMRGEPRQFVYSKGACWLALDRAIRLAQHAGFRSEVQAWTSGRQALRHSFQHFGFNAEVGAFVQSYGSRALDASILRLPIMGVIDANDPKMLATIERIENDLMRNGVVYRYRNDDGLAGNEGAFAAWDSGWWTTISCAAA